jgi:predicted ribosome quality control (RQC) complex YloA/Tae2 family protein
MPGTPTPKDRFTSVDTLALVRELRALHRARVDKAFDLPAGGWSVVLRVPGQGRRELVLVPGRYAALVQEGVAHAEELSRVAKELRRLLTGAVLRSVAEPRGERFLELVFGHSTDASELTLAVELFGTGNLVIAEENRIVAVASPRQWAHRTVRVGSPYERPPSRSDPWGLSRAELENELARSRTDLASTLAARLSLGGPVAEELIARGGWNGAEAAAVAASQLAPSLHTEMQRLIAEVGERPSGHLYLRDMVTVDATPYASRRWEDVAGVTRVDRRSFSDAAFEYFPSLVGPPVTPEEAAAARARRDLERQVDRQRKAVEGLTRSVDELKAQAEEIFRHFAVAEAAVSKAAAKEGREPRIEVELGEHLVPLYRDRSPRESAQALYEEAKRMQSKLAGAQAALRESEGRLALAPRVAALPVAAARPSKPKTRWFERFRWFISSEGAIVVAGRDAASNDLIVKRHLKEGDVYVHADLHGAASVVVKHPEPSEPPLTEATYREAGQWAVAFSKAWRAGLASAGAFWATPEQVSKAGESGEFVARGAWVVRGTKRVMRDLPTELALGTIEYEGETRWMVAPPDAVRLRGVVRVLLTPGEERERPEREVELSRELGIPRSVLQSLLPAGGLTLRRP